jgi:hypothetical protein
MGRAQNHTAAVSTFSPRGARSHALEIKTSVRAAVSAALGCDCEVGDDYGDMPDFYYPDTDSEISLSVELLGSTLSITRISCEPQGHGLGKRVVNAICATAAAHGLTVEAPDPFETSLPFWQSLGARDVGVGERTILRLHEPLS